MDRYEKLCSAGVILAFTLLSLAYILILPPWEGFDEPAHYSYISSLADRGEIPNFKTTPLDACMEEASVLLPRPYGGDVPFEVNGGLTYHTFFSAENTAGRIKAFEKLWLAKMDCAGYKPGTGINWQGQHPPLYYGLMILPYKASTSWPLGWRILLFRLLSVFLACLGLYFWLKTILLFDSMATRITLIHGGLVVLFFPSMFYDLARLGNDSLASLLLSASIYTFLRAWNGRDINIMYLLLTGLTLGLGLLTKMFFVVILAAYLLVGVYLAFRGGAVSLKRLSWLALAIGFAPFLISSWWFALYHQRYGVYFGSHEMYLFSLVDVPPGDSMTAIEFLKSFMRGARRFWITFMWSGTWSWINRPYWEYLLIAPLLLLAAYGYLFRMAQRSLAHLLSLAILACLLVGFACHIYARVRFVGVGAGTGGYYLFFAWPALAALFSSTFANVNNARGRIITMSVFAAAFCFELSGWWLEIQVYSGLLEKVGDNKNGVGYIPPSLHNVSLAFERLKEIAFPYAASATYLAALSIKMALTTAFIFRPVQTRPNSTSPLA
jgi:hypothetical protein